MSRLIGREELTGILKIVQSALNVFLLSTYYTPGTVLLGAGEIFYPRGKPT